MRRLVLVAASIVIAAPAFAQQQTQTTKADPIQCWWRTSSGAVRVGEPFTAVMTCAVLETSDVKVVPDQTKLEPSVVQFAPFEVTGGSHAVDLHTDDRRFFQYEYRMRLIAENLFGKDVAVPETKISYRVQSKTGQGTSIEGRDQTYVLPALAMRVLSLVPSDASDIRDAGAETFAEIDQRGFRANLLTVTGGILFALAGLLGILAIVRIVARYRKPAEAAERVMPDLAVLRGVGRELAAVRRERQSSGWTPALATRGLAALRVIGAYATGRKVSKATQSTIDTRQSTVNAPAIDGQLVLRTGVPPKRKTVIVSGAATPAAAAREAVRLRARGFEARAQELESLEQALARFTTAQYAQAGTLDESALDEGVATGLTLLRRLQVEQLWPMRRFAKRYAVPSAAAGTKVWSR
ncbi:MAG TPA: hypothetical protein VFA27_09515 [Vicinamibacterales bacterium]|nr:hypothetical protein [Vicinamibacterales bacterium]